MQKEKNYKNSESKIRGKKISRKVTSLTMKHS